MKIKTVEVDNLGDPMEVDVVIGDGKTVFDDNFDFDARIFFYFENETQFKSAIGTYHEEIGFTITRVPCPTCDGQIPNNETPGAYSGAISRKDNSTEICSACGTQEALADFFKSK